MKKIDFKVTFLSDIVLQASSNNEGKIENLDFIPGSNFLGMVARNYTAFDNPFDIFHSGKVRFGDASLLVDDKPTYKVPFSYYKPKLGGNPKNHHLIEKFSADEQLKQIRSGFITSDGTVVKPRYNYTQKSAYDKINRRSKDGTMYGFSAIQKDMTWQFSLTYDASIEIKQVVEKLLGKKQLGKSKSAQYGSIMIEKFDAKSEDIEDTTKVENVVLYAKSRWALFDKNGMPTYQPTSESLGIDPKAKILWDKCQIRTLSYTPYNTARKTKDYSRVVIEKGSVIVLDKVSKEDIEKLQSGVGAYLSEGFGEVLINPIFTQELEPAYHEGSLTLAKTKSLDSDKRVITFLTNRKKEQQDNFEVAKDVDAFIQAHKTKFKEVSKSQWGQIRSICSQSDVSDKNIKEKISNFIDHGVAKKRWEKGEKVLLEAVEQNLKFAKLLSILMPKQKGEKND